MVEKKSPEGSSYGGSYGSRVGQLIYGKIAAVLNDVAAVGKNERNVEQKFNFRGIDAVVNAVNPVLKKHGVFISHEVLEHSADRYENMNKKLVTDARVKVAYTWYAEDGSSVTNVAVGEARDFADKATAKAMSVAFRTHLIQLLALPTDETDPDSTSLEVTVGESGKKNATTSAPAPQRESTGLKGLQDTIRDIISSNEYTDPKTGVVSDVSKVDGLVVNKIGEKISGKEGTAWKSDEQILQKVIDEILK